METGANTFFYQLNALNNLELNNFASGLWSDEIIDRFTSQGINPFEGVVDLFILPYVPTDSTTPTSSIIIGNTQINTGAKLITNRYTTLVVGTFNAHDIIDDMMKQNGLLPNNRFVAYFPYTKMYAYLPYVGEVQLDERKYYDLNQDVQLVYDIDLATGDFTAEFRLVAGSSTSEPTYTLLDSFDGNMATRIPVTGSKYTGFNGRQTSGNASIGAITGSIAGMVAGPAGVAAGAITGGLGAIAVDAIKALSAVPNVDKLGALSCNNPNMSDLLRTPFIYFEQAEVEGTLVEKQNPTMVYYEHQQVLGIPYSQYSTLQELKNTCPSDDDGYTICKRVDTSRYSGTSKEVEELESILLSGFYVN